jgi:recombination protein RecA
VLGGGWAVGRVSNIVGDKAAGKTLIAVEACANFARVCRSLEDIRYIEAESAYDEAYGQQIGMPPGVHPVDNIHTVEQLFADLEQFVRRKRSTPALYVVDSLDALSDADEMERPIEKGTYGAGKAKLMSELFRRTAADIHNSNCALLIVSQLRDTIGVMFGERQKRSGGRALDFYASQVVWLSELRKIERRIKGVDRIVGTNVRVRNKKNKVGKPFREADVTLWFEYGIDDEGSCLDYLEKHKAANGVDLNDIRKQVGEARRHQDRNWLKEINALLCELVDDHWQAVERATAPPMRKYA